MKYSFDSNSLWMTYICNRRNDKKYGPYKFVFNGQNELFEFDLKMQLGIKGI